MHWSSSLKGRCNEEPMHSNWWSFNNLLSCGHKLFSLFNSLGCFVSHCMGDVFLVSWVIPCMGNELTNGALIGY